MLALDQQNVKERAWEPTKREVINGHPTRNNVLLSELRRLVTLYEMVHPTSPIHEGGSPFCDFDMDLERCSWYNQQVGIGGSGFKRARFESFFDVEKFQCTSERYFEFSEFEMSV
jgi:hypothetical protein